ncbi:hypothetical protein EK904_006416 [Melospiza melodia maxima]|nr:hypothetical protein EK904_006416 [Melospiza melodia maxima]
MNATSAAGMCLKHTEGLKQSSTRLPVLLFILSMSILPRVLNYFYQQFSIQPIAFQSSGNSSKGSHFDLEYKSLPTHIPVQFSAFYCLYSGKDNCNSNSQVTWLETSVIQLQNRWVMAVLSLLQEMHLCLHPTPTEENCFNRNMKRQKKTPHKAV